MNTKGDAFCICEKNIKNGSIVYFFPRGAMTKYHMAFFSLCFHKVLLSVFLSSSNKDVGFTEFKAHEKDLVLTQLKL